MKPVKSQFDAEVGIGVDANWAEPAIWSRDEDIEASWRYLQFNIGWFLHPFFKNGDYADIMKERIEEIRNQIQMPNQGLPQFTEDEKNANRQSCDFIRTGYKNL